MAVMPRQKRSHHRNVFCVHVGPKRLSGLVLSLSAHFKVPASKEQFSVGMRFYSWSDARHQPVGSECVAELSESRGKQKGKFGVSCPNGNKCTVYSSISKKFQYFPTASGGITQW